VYIERYTLDAGLSENMVLFHACFLVFVKSGVHMMISTLWHSSTDAVY
jgi:hypothetical protein